MRSLTLPSLFAVLCFVAGCSGSSSAIGTSGGGSDLFAAPEGDVTPDAIYGVWGGSMTEGDINFDTRWRFTNTELTLANKCTLRDGRESGVVSVTARARVNESEITILESKKDEERSGDFVCRVNAQPRSIAACKILGGERECFRLSGKTLTIYGDGPFNKLELVKLSD